MDVPCASIMPRSTAVIWGLEVIEDWIAAPSEPVRRPVARPPMHQPMIAPSWRRRAREKLPRSQGRALARPDRPASTLAPTSRRAMRATTTAVQAAPSASGRSSGHHRLPV
jgi:hypothetical protein